jgi:hypothetical protein
MSPFTFLKIRPKGASKEVLEHKNNYFDSLKFLRIGVYQFWGPPCKSNVFCIGNVIYCFETTLFKVLSTAAELELFSKFHNFHSQHKSISFKTFKHPPCLEIKTIKYTRYCIHINLKILLFCK